MFQTPEFSLANQRGTVGTPVDNPWSPFFGDPPYISRDMLPAEGRKLTSVPDLPEAYRGQNYYIPEIIQQLVMTTDNFYTQILAPIEKTDQITWTLNITTFDQHMSAETPYKSTSRITDFRRESQTGRLLRRGIAFEMENDFFRTEAGQRHYSFTLNQMANAIILTVNLDIIRTILEKGHYQRVWEQENNLRVSTDLRAKIQREIEEWAITQKTQFGLKKLDVLVTERMTAWQGKANTWVLPPQLLAWNDIVPPENTLYLFQGPRAPLNVDDAVRPKGILNGNPVYSCRVYEGVTEFGTRNLLSQQREIGSFYVLSGRQENLGDDYYTNHYSSKHRSFKAYDENKDDNGIITLKMAHDAMVGVFDDRNGSVFLPQGNKLYSDVNDRDDDAFSYTDPITNERKPTKLFGHVDGERHFRTDSLLNGCKTMAGFLAKRSGKTVGQMDEILQNGIRLARKIGEQQVDMRWFWNVMFEHAIQTGVSGAEFNGDDADTRLNAYVKKMTQPSKRGNYALRVIAGVGSRSGLSLPRHHYSGGLTKINLDDIQNDTTLSTAFAQLSGGSTPGALAGFGNWDGFLALQAELNSGPGSSIGYTKHGYLISDCEMANQFVNLIRLLVSHAEFLFKNQYFLDRNRASETVENPSIEHVVTEYILNMGGLPVWLGINHLDAVVDKDIDGGDVGGDVNVWYKASFDKEYTEFKSTAIAPWKSLVSTLVKGKALSAEQENDFNNNLNNMLAATSFLKENERPASITWQSMLMRNVFSHMSTTLLKTKTSKKTSLVEKFMLLLNFLIDIAKNKTSLGDNLSSLMGFAEREMSFTNDQIQNIFEEFRTAEDKDKSAVSKDVLSVSQIYPKPDRPSSVMAGNNNKYSVDSIFEAGSDERIDLDDPGNVQHFFRSPLVLSAKQISQLKELMKKDASQNRLMRIRVSNPNELSACLDISATYMLIERIERLNEETMSMESFEGNVPVAMMMNREPISLFYPENTKRAAAAFASIPLDRITVSSSSSKRKRANEGFNGGNTKRRAGNVRSLLIDEDEDEGSSSSSFISMDNRDLFSGTDVDSMSQQVGLSGGGRRGGGKIDDHITPNLVKQMVRLNASTSSPLLLLWGQLYLTSTLDKPTLDKFIEHDILYPFGFLVFQPHKRYMSNAGIKIWGGRETAVTLICHEGMSIQSNAANKTTIGHFTHHHGTVIKQARDIYIARDIFISKALGGAGLDPIIREQYDLRNGRIGNGSIIFVPVPYEETEFDPIIDATGRFETVGNVGNFIDRANLMKKHYSQAWRTQQVWQFRDTDMIVNVNEPFTADEQGQFPHNNTVLARGQQYNFSHATGTYSEKITNKGHWGDEGPGSKAARNGALEPLVKHTVTHII